MTAKTSLCVLLLVASTQVAHSQQIDQTNTSRLIQIAINTISNRFPETSVTNLVFYEIKPVRSERLGLLYYVTFWEKGTVQETETATERITAGTQFVVPIQPDGTVPPGEANKETKTYRTSKTGLTRSAHGHIEGKDKR
jgi:hypothetical protein